MIELLRANADTVRNLYNGSENPGETLFAKKKHEHHEKYEHNKKNLQQLLKATCFCSAPQKHVAV